MSTKNERSKKYRQVRRETKRCQQCSSPDLVAISRCRRCTLKLLARRHLGDTKKWTLLAEKWENQGGLCYYTQRPLTLGKNASIEHINPVSRYERDRYSPSNVHWVCCDVNLAKRNKTIHEFLSLCKEVLENFGYTVNKD